MEVRTTKALCLEFVQIYAHLFMIPKDARIILKVKPMKARGFYYNEFDDEGEFHVIALNPKMHLTACGVFSTMAHELIHCEQRIKRIGVAHTEWFWDRVAGLEKLLPLDGSTIGDKELDK